MFLHKEGAGCMSSIITMDRPIEEREISSFYGVYSKSKTLQDQESSVSAPVNESYGPHIQFEKLVWQDVDIWRDETV